MATEPTIKQSATATHVEITPGICGGKPRIAGHRIRVQDIVLWTEEGQSPDEIVASFPQLSLADVYSALAFYHDNRAQVDQDIQQDDKFIQRMKAQAGPGLLQPRPVTEADGGDPLPS
jgi:uncharacterized protein (DUF433 family)